MRSASLRGRGSCCHTPAGLPRGYTGRLAELSLTVPGIALAQSDAAPLTMPPLCPSTEVAQVSRKRVSLSTPTVGGHDGG